MIIISEKEIQTADEVRISAIDIGEVRSIIESDICVNLISAGKMAECSREIQMPMVCGKIEEWNFRLWDMVLVRKGRGKWEKIEKVIISS